MYRDKIVGLALPQITVYVINNYQLLNIINYKCHYQVQRNL